MRTLADATCSLEVIHGIIATDMKKGRSDKRKKKNKYKFKIYPTNRMSTTSPTPKEINKKRNTNFVQEKNKKVTKGN